jgi:UDP-N-acetylglucosamine 3-dehydrogenase
VDEVLRDPWVDAVVVATPTATHADLVLSALAAGKHVLCETPIALEAEDARRMERAASTSAGILQVALNRFDAALRLLVDLVRSEHLGLPINIATRRLSAWRADGLAKAHHGDVVEEFLAFDLDFLMWAFGAPIAVSAHADWCEGRADAVTALVDLPACTALCFATLRMSKGYPFTESAEVLFRRGRAELTTRFWPGRVERRLAITHLDGRIEVLPSVGEDPALAQARHFVKVISGRGAPAYADAAAARALLEVTLGCREAARTGRRTPLRALHTEQVGAL